MHWIITSLEKLGVAGALIAAISCAACFPALGALGAAVGLGVFSQFEGVAINILLPLFTSVALMVNTFHWYQHRNHWRGAFAVLGPIAIMATLYPLWHFAWSTLLFYAALALMLATSTIDFIWPTKKRCGLTEMKND